MAPQLRTRQKAELLVGASFWATRPAAEAAAPALSLTDGPHGVRKAAGDEHGLADAVPATCFPPAVGMGSSWDKDLAHRVGAAIGREGRALEVDVVLGPGVNIKRSPLCGRNFEYYSEDPLIAGALAAAHVRGQQQAGSGASVKHFAANNQETDRMRVDAQVDERTLREIYFPAFETVVRQASPATVMASYNKVNGTHAAQNRWLLTEVLRGDWGFEGAVVSDWGAVVDPVESVRAGLDLQMPGPADEAVEQIVQAVDSGDLAVADLDRAVDRVLALRRWHTGEPGDPVDHEAHHALAREAATRSAVLLKNDEGVLPLSVEARIAVIGEFARTPRFQGGGSSQITPTRVDDALDALRQGAEKVTFAAGFSLGEADSEPAALLAEAVSVAAASEVAVVFAGLADADESEGFDRPGLTLPEDQVAVIRAVAAVAPHTVVVLSHGGVVTMQPWHDEVAAILDGVLLGQAGGSALADLLLGVANPSGHLAETIPVELRRTSAYLNFPGDHSVVRYGEGVFVGYRDYATTGTPVQYPFGHGLSYTRFETGALQVASTGPDSARVSIEVANVGDRAGRHVVQVYVGGDAGPVQRPVRELRAFESIMLDPGERRTVTVDLDDRAFAYWDVEVHDWVVPGGTYRVEIGQSAHDIVAAAEVELTGNERPRPLTLDSTVGEWASHPAVGAKFKELLARVLGGDSDGSDGSGDSSEDSDLSMLQLLSSMPVGKAATMLGVPQVKDDLEALASRTVSRAQPGQDGEVRR